MKFGLRFMLQVSQNVKELDCALMEALVAENIITE